MKSKGGISRDCRCAALGGRSVTRHHARSRRVIWSLLVLSGGSLLVMLSLPREQQPNSDTSFPPSIREVMSEAVSDSKAGDVRDAAPDCLADLLQCSDDELTGLDIAVVNALCAEGLPGAEGLCIETMRGRFDNVDVFCCFGFVQTVEGRRRGSLQWSTCMEAWEMHRFDRFSNAGQREGRDDLRWCGEIELADDVESEIQAGRILEEWDCETAVHLRRTSPTEDMPWVCGGFHVVSQRLRGLLDKHAPQHAQYLPVRMLFDGYPISCGPYFLANWLHECDCIDQQAVQLLPMPQRVVVGVVIDPARVPPEVMIARLEGGSRVIIRDDLRRILEAARINGCQYYCYPHVDEVREQYGTEA